MSEDNCKFVVQGEHPNDYRYIIEQQRQLIDILLRERSAPPTYVPTPITPPSWPGLQGPWYSPTYQPTITSGGTAKP